MKPKIAIVGAGPAGCFAACNLNKSFEITLFDKSSPLSTILPTGGGRCNLAHAEYDFKELAKHYPRGEKFLYSVFSKFGTQDTLDFFNKIGINTYTQENGRIFPVSNSSKEIRSSILNLLNHCRFTHEEIISIKKLENGFEIKSEKSSYFFDAVIVSIGGKSGYKLLEKTHEIIEAKPALVGLNTLPKYKDLQGVSVKNVSIISDNKKLEGDLLFTNNGLTGPIIFELSSLNARKELPYQITINFLNREIDLQNLFNKNPHKDLKNLLYEILPKSLINKLLEDKNINIAQKCHEVTSNTKNLILNYLTNNNFKIISTRKDGEIVTAGGIDLKYITSKTMESKILSDLYFCGEVINVDGFCGGYNLQNCWSTGYIVATAINSKFS